MKTNWALIVPNVRLKQTGLVFLLAASQAFGCKAKQASSAAPALAASAEAKWSACAGDAECVLSYGPCGEWAAVNALFKIERETWARRKGAEIGCPRNRQPKPKAGCRQKICVVIPS